VNDDPPPQLQIAMLAEADDGQSAKSTHRLGTLTVQAAWRFVFAAVGLSFSV
jgi:hypothetical protein